MFAGELAVESLEGKRRVAPAGADGLEPGDLEPRERPGLGLLAGRMRVEEPPVLGEGGVGAAGERMPARGLEEPTERRGRGAVRSKRGRMEDGAAIGHREPGPGGRARFALEGDETSLEPVRATGRRSAEENLFDPDQLVADAGRLGLHPAHRAMPGQLGDHGLLGLESPDLEGEEDRGRDDEEQGQGRGRQPETAHGPFPRPPRPTIRNIEFSSLDPAHPPQGSHYLHGPARFLEDEGPELVILAIRLGGAIAQRRARRARQARPKTSAFRAHRARTRIRSVPDHAGRETNASDRRTRLRSRSIRTIPGG